MWLIWGIHFLFFFSSEQQRSFAFELSNQRKFVLFLCEFDMDFGYGCVVELKIVKLE